MSHGRWGMERRSFFRGKLKSLDFLRIGKYCDVTKIDGDYTTTLIFFVGFQFILSLNPGTPLCVKHEALALSKAKQYFKLGFVVETSPWFRVS